ncbi:hypothetical protein SH668x_000311 [Planctomicrobium sp. SH668]|uniref:hypothetical protein n=1 Tax=Planctomicrobium sp. SH668 TaxID=3448126 RepID=UPI003F5B7819
MSAILTQIVNSDLQLMFADWGKPARYDILNRQYNVLTGVVDEYVESREVTVIALRRRERKQTEMSASSTDLECQFLVPDSMLPNRIPLSNARLVQGGETFEICTVAETEVTGLVLLNCVAHMKLD